MVAELIDKDGVSWGEDLIRSLFLPCDVEVILGILLSIAWPQDKLVWHSTTSIDFLVQSAYHLKGQQRLGEKAGSS